MQELIVRFELYKFVVEEIGEISNYSDSPISEIPNPKPDSQYDFREAIDEFNRLHTDYKIVCWVWNANCHRFYKV